MKNRDETPTFAPFEDGKGGIPIPLTMECLVTSMNHANSEAVYFGNMPEISNRRMRQVSAIRKRILRMDAEKGDELRKWHKLSLDLRQRIRDLLKEKKHWQTNYENCVLRRVDDKKRIAELESLYASSQELIRRLDAGEKL